MHPLQIAKIVVWVHVLLVAVAVYYVTRIWNYTPLSAMPSDDSLVFAATALPPLMTLWIGARLARNEKAGWLLALGLIVALAVFALAFLAVLSAGQEPLAPLFLIMASLWLAGGLAIVLVAVWFIGRSGNPGRDGPQ